MRKTYQSDLSDKRWEAIKPFLPKEFPGGRPREVNLREIVNAIFYINKTGCSWRDLPGDFPPWQTVYTYFRDWKNSSVWKKINDILRKRLRKQEGREFQASAGVIDSQSVKTSLPWWCAWLRWWKKDPWPKTPYSS